MFSPGIAGHQVDALEHLGFYLAVLFGFKVEVGRGVSLRRSGRSGFLGGGCRCRDGLRDRGGLHRLGGGWCDGFRDLGRRRGMLQPRLGDEQPARKCNHRKKQKPDERGDDLLERLWLFLVTERRQGLMTFGTDKLAIGYGGDFIAKREHASRAVRAFALAIHGARLEINATSSKCKVREMRSPPDPPATATAIRIAYRRFQCGASRNARRGAAAAASAASAGVQPVSMKVK